MSITRLQVTGVRNLAPVTLTPSPGINLLTGANGSGKTSLLEAVYFLGMARSFRSSKIQPMIQHGQPHSLVYAEFALPSGEQFKLGIQRELDGSLSIRKNGENLRSVAGLARLVPVQLINPESFSLLEGSPKNRRQFVDWGVFHMEPDFLSAWQRCQASLKQRNSILRHAIIDRTNLQVWSHEFVASSTLVDQYRQDYIRLLKPVFSQVLEQLIQLPDLSLGYNRGWDKERPLDQVLESNLARDQQSGHTQSGPQRADLRLRVAGKPATDILSRGQQKLVISALKIAQGKLLSEALNQRCIFLVDDLAAELDQQHRGTLCNLLEGLGCQTFITGTDQESFSGLNWNNQSSVAMFHVEHGHIKVSGVTA